MVLRTGQGACGKSIEEIPKLFGKVLLFILNSRSMAGPFVYFEILGDGQLHVLPVGYFLNSSDIVIIFEIGIDLAGDSV